MGVKAFYVEGEWRRYVVFLDELREFQMGGRGDREGAGVEGGRVMGREPRPLAMAGVFRPLSQVSQLAAAPGDYPQPVAVPLENSLQ
jgi:hypothetical protein